MDTMTTTGGVKGLERPCRLEKRYFSFVIYMSEKLATDVFTNNLRYPMRIFFHLPMMSLSAIYVLFIEVGSSILKD